LKNEEIIEYLLENKILEVFWENENIDGTNFQIFGNIDYYAIIKNVEFKSLKKIEPIYIKKPSIS
jgi:hypothetical protein